MGSTSSSTPPRPLSEDLLHAVYELATVKPHIREDARFTAESWTVYCEGYYMALGWALTVMRFVLAKRKTFKRLRQRLAATQRAESGRLEALGHLQVREELRVPSQVAVRHRPQRWQRVDGNGEATWLVAPTVAERKYKQLRLRFALNVPLEVNADVGGSHAAKYRVQSSKSQPKT